MNVPVKFDFPSFWKSHYVIYVPAQYHVTGSCKGPIANHFPKLSECDLNAKKTW